MSSVCAQISGVSCDITSFLCIKKRNFANVLDHPMPSSPSKKSNMMRLLSSSIFYWFCFIKILELKKSILLLSWRHDLWVSPHQLSILFQLGRVCHPVHDYLLPIWLALCSSWESSPDLSFHGTLLCRVRSQKQVRKLHQRWSCYSGCFPEYIVCHFLFLRLGQTPDIWISWRLGSGLYLPGGR